MRFSSPAMPALLLLLLPSSLGYSLPKAGRPRLAVGHRLCRSISLAETNRRSKDAAVADSRASAVTARAADATAASLADDSRRERASLADENVRLRQEVADLTAQNERLQRMADDAAAEIFRAENLAAAARRSFLNNLGVVNLLVISTFGIGIVYSLLETDIRAIFALYYFDLGPDVYPGFARWVVALDLILRLPGELLHQHEALSMTCPRHVRDVSSGELLHQYEALVPTNPVFYKARTSATLSHPLPPASSALRLCRASEAPPRPCGPVFCKPVPPRRHRRRDAALLRNRHLCSSGPFADPSRTVPASLRHSPAGVHLWRRVHLRRLCLPNLPGAHPRLSRPAPLLPLRRRGLHRPRPAPPPRGSRDGVFARPRRVPDASPRRPALPLLDAHDGAVPRLWRSVVGHRRQGAERQPRDSREAAEGQPRGSRGTAERQPRFSREAAERQPRDSREAAEG